MQPKNDIRLICFDLDGTLFRHPHGMVIWEALNLRYGGSPEINRQRYDMYYNGVISYAEWVDMDAGGWQSMGATRDEMLEVAGEFSLVEGARETIHELKNRGFKLAVISGSIDIMLDHLFPDHPFEDVFTNRVNFDDAGRLSSWQATPYDGRGKSEALKIITGKHDVPLEQSAFVGDGDNDVSVLGVAGFFVAVKPKSATLAERADVVIHDEGVHALLDIFRR